VTAANLSSLRPNITFVFQADGGNALGGGSLRIYGTNLGGAVLNGAGAPSASLSTLSNGAVAAAAVAAAAAAGSAAADRVVTLHDAAAGLWQPCSNVEWHPGAGTGRLGGAFLQCVAPATPAGRKDVTVSVKVRACVRSSASCSPR
jgi:hypothetical protein